MDDIVALPKERELESIKQASLRDAPCRLSFPSAGDDAVVSALLHTDRAEAGGERELFVAAPAGVDAPGRDESIQVRFDNDGLSLLFATRYEGSANLKTSAGASVAAWRMKWPQGVFVIQRRAFFRVRANATDPVKVGITPTTRARSSSASGRNSRRATGKVSTRSPKSGWDKKGDEVDGILWDISAGGLSFTLIPEPAFQLKNGCEIEMELNLGSGDPVQLKGRVVSGKQQADHSTIYSVTYTDTESTVKLRRSHKQVLQYVAQREREILASHRQSSRRS